MPAFCGETEETFNSGLYLQSSGLGPLCQRCTEKGVALVIVRDCTVIKCCGPSCLVALTTSNRT